MNLQTNPNGWSCLPTAAAMVLGIDKSRLIEHIGHDGSEIKNTNLKDPHRRRGFHPQEIIDAGWMYGIAIVEIQAMPYSTPGDGTSFQVDFKINPVDRFDSYLMGTKGVITGLVNEVGHAVAWDGKKIYDPRGRVYDLNILKMDIDSYWLFQEIKSN